jgi:hypothetical protein
MTGPTTDRARGTAALRRPVLLGVAWAGSAAAAVGLGFLAVSLLDASASPGTPQVAAATSSAPGAGGEAGPTATRFVPKSTSATGEFATAAGTVYATCGTGLPVLAGVPLAGWWIDDSGAEGKVEFQNGTQQIEVRVACVDGSPRFASEGAQSEDDATSTSAHMPPAVAPEPTAAPTSDDHGGGGHGSDDGPGDDSGGHGGGGHGSDG